MRRRAHPGWGGRRAGAGRKPGPNPQGPHTSRPAFSSAHVAHVTLKAAPGIPTLRAPRVVHAIEHSFAHGCRRPGFRLVQYSLQSNHAHLIVEARDRGALGCGMMAIASRLARAVNRTYERSGKVFDERYRLHLLRTPREVRAALRDVLLNTHHVQPSGPSDPASSARWFDGWRPGPDARHPETLGPTRDDPAVPLVPVARARTWLLRVGWRRHGLLDPTDVPGS